MPLSDAQSGSSKLGIEDLSSVVFERTDLGTAAIKSSVSDIPRTLRTLMLVVDGRSNVAQYQPFLSAMGSLPEKFDELERLGYLRRKAKETLASKANDERIQKATIDDVVSRPIKPTISQTVETLNEADLLNLALDISVLKGPDYGNASNNFAPELQALASNISRDSKVSYLATGVSLYRQSDNQNLTGSRLYTDTPTLQDLLAEMEKFLSSEAGLDGLPLALMFGQITSLAQLRRELPAYLELIQPYGAKADVHVKQLSDLLDRAQSQS
jgi:hypothetical protein